MSVQSQSTLIPSNGLTAPSEQQLNAITQAIAGLSAQQLIWTSGYLAGLAASGQSSAAPAPVPTQAAAGPSLTVLYGSQTGNAKGIAKQVHAQAISAGYTAKVISMADFKPRQLKSETHLVVVVSTHGEGDAPDDAVELYDYLHSKKAPKLNGLKFSVLALGDSSYEFYCQTGKDFDAKLAELGGTRINDRVDCDVDYEAAAQQWTESLIGLLKGDFTAAAVAQPSTAMAPQTTATAQYNKKSPYAAELLTVQKITGRDSVKDIRHIEISLEDSGIVYQPGDALGVWFDNSAELVSELLSLTNIAPTEQVTVGDDSVTIQDALTSKLELTLSYPGFIKAYQQASESAPLAALLEDKAALRSYLDERQIIDIVRDYPANISAQQLVDALRPITPRLYSIASSQEDVGEEVHLTVAHVDYQAFERRHQGGASGYLCERLPEGETVRVFVENNDNFRLPSDPNTPIIMVGPGTGIAPFRAFIQHRDAQQADGKNWLFFGNPNFTQDFLYQTEWQGYVKDGLLHKVSLAFSRDQEQKIYVQHRLLEQGAEVFEWLEQGAHFYVCGDAMKMAKDVEAALLLIIQQHGKRSEQDAKAYLLAMRKAKRYQKDVY